MSGAARPATEARRHGQKISPCLRAFVACGIVALTVVFFPLAAQQPGVHPVSGRVYALPMGVAGAPWLDRTEREREEDPDLAMRLIRVERGSTVADLGAGSGYFTVRLARAVGAAASQNRTRRVTLRSAKRLDMESPCERRYDAADWRRRATRTSRE